MKFKSKSVFNLFLFIYLSFGMYIAVNVGMTTDELPNHNIGMLNIEAIKDILGFNDNGYSDLEKFPWRYKGPAFYYLSYIYLFVVDFFYREVHILCLDFLQLRAFLQYLFYLSINGDP